MSPTHLIPLFLFLLISPPFSYALSYLPNDPYFNYEGRWDKTSSSTTYRTDWPCARVTFGVSGEGDLNVKWRGIRVRLNATVWDGEGNILGTEIVKAKSVGRDLKDEVLSISVPEGATTVTIRRLTEGANFGAGIGEKLLTSSMWEFEGLSVGGSLSLSRPRVRRHYIEFIGASDTAGYCVDGDPSITGARLYLDGWEYDNCDAGYPGILGYELDSDVGVAAEGGLGITRNAPGEGRTTMRGYWNNQTLLTDPIPAWGGPEEGSRTPDVVVVSLGGNDYNHHRGHVPDDGDFVAAYGEFMMEIFKSYAGSPVQILSVCGQGSPAEAAYDPDNNRCSPCPHVEEAVSAFKDSVGGDYGDRVSYLFVPCDGSVVTGDGDIGCGGHKNRLGQGKVAEFVLPVVKGILEGM
ncbi:hypothetical protein TrCOL_g6938 [Triparma columacea]|uniref:SGNH hydrolase-type esterase domain-containing protein n=1 Tax=Triparma columacea TaxID=722753 RepID=A0A9W7GE79_9STRA|nr:hypothetical protein TrCOL_g6938 [Triparma columacea]